VIHRFVLHNDDIREASGRMLSPGQVGLLTGWGVFSTLRVTEGVLFAFERHWARISRDAAAFHVPIPDEPEHLRRRLLDLVDANQAYNSTLRLVIVRNGGGMWAATSTGPAFDVIALTAESNRSRTERWGAPTGCAKRCKRRSRSTFGGTPPAETGGGADEIGFVSHFLTAQLAEAGSKARHNSLKTKDRDSDGLSWNFAGRRP
jgi:branched-subunit amino acid aminotransferase/4-amino-4-deoxychorismate lyase